METVNIKAVELSPAQRSVIEELVGRTLDETETVGVRVMPDAARIEQSRKALIDFLQMREGASGSAAADEISEEIITEAIRTVRPGYRPMS